jgi:uncharacterized protein with PQ loop repeat
MKTPAFEYLMFVMPFIGNAFIYLQAYKIWKRQSHDDVSFLTSIFGIVTAIIWSYYGLIIDSTPLMLSGIIAAVGFILIVYLKKKIPSNTANGWKWI